MQRLIKFRAWDKTENKWIPYFEISASGNFVKCFKPNYINPEAELMQYTGLKDKNGVEIYEGDIVKYNGGAEDFFSEVSFEHGCFIAKMPWIKGELSYPELKYYIDMKFVSAEVIGNIYENPELIEVDNGK